MRLVGLLTLLLGLKMASPCSILLRAFSASAYEAFMKDGWTMTRFLYPVGTGYYTLILNTGIQYNVQYNPHVVVSIIIIVYLHVLYTHTVEM